MLGECGGSSTGAALRRGCFMWDQPGMQVHLLRRSSLRSVFQRCVVSQRCVSAAQSVPCPGTPQEADMIRNRAQIKRVLCVAEKNDAAKGISEIMSNGRSRRVRPVLWSAVYKSVTTCFISHCNSSWRLWTPLFEAVLIIVHCPTPTYTLL